MEGQWTNPVATEVKGVMQVVFPGGDGWLYAFEAKSGMLLWKFDCNLKKSVYKSGGKGDRSFIVATPVIHDNKLYIGVGQNPGEDGPGVGHLWCVDITKEPKNKDKDLSAVDDNVDPKAPVNKDSGLVWHYGGHIVPKPARGRDFVFGRTVMHFSSVYDGPLYAAEFDGFLHCFDAKTGQSYWSHDMKDGTWASTYYVDGKVYIGTDGGNMLVFKEVKAKRFFDKTNTAAIAALGQPALLGKEKIKPKVIDMQRTLQVPVVVANGVRWRH